MSDLNPVEIHSMPNFNYRDSGREERTGSVQLVAIQGPELAKILKCY